MVIDKINREGSPPPTADKLRHAIDREGQGDKVDFPDPAAAPLGTDAEAAGNPPTNQELAMETVKPKPRPRDTFVGPVIYALIAVAIFVAFATLVLNAMS